MDAVHEAAVLQPRVLRLRRPERAGVTGWPCPHAHPACPLPAPPLTSTFSTTCLPKEHTLVETLMVMLSAELYWELTP